MMCPLEISPVDVQIMDRRVPGIRRRDQGGPRRRDEIEKGDHDDEQETGKLKRFADNPKRLSQDPGSQQEQFQAEENEDDCRIGQEADKTQGIAIHKDQREHQDKEGEAEERGAHRQRT